MGGDAACPKRRPMCSRCCVAWAVSLMLWLQTRTCVVCMQCRAEQHMVGHIIGRVGQGPSPIPFHRVGDM